MNTNFNNKSEQTANPKKNALNALDILIIIIVIASVAGIVFRIVSADKKIKPEEMDEFKIGFAVYDIADTTAAEVFGGDTVYDGDGNEIGTVIGGKTDSLTAVAAKYFIEDANGKYVEVSYPDSGRVDASGEILCRGYTESDGSFVLRGEKIVTPGDRIQVHTSTVDFIITVLSVTPV